MILWQNIREKASKNDKIKLNKYFSGYFALVIIFIILWRIRWRIWQQWRIRTRTTSWLFLWFWCGATQQGLFSSRPDWSVIASSSSSASPSSITMMISSSISWISSTSTASTTVWPEGTRVVGLPFVVLLEQWRFAALFWDDAARWRGENGKDIKFDCILGKVSIWFVYCKKYRKQNKNKERNLSLPLFYR